MRVAIIPIVIGVFGTVTKGLLKGLEDLGDLEDKYRPSKLFIWYFVHFEAVYYPALRNHVICIFVINPGHRFSVWSYSHLGCVDLIIIQAEDQIEIQENMMKQLKVIPKEFFEDWEGVWGPKGSTLKRTKVSIPVVS